MIVPLGRPGTTVCGRPVSASARSRAAASGSSTRMRGGLAVAMGTPVQVVQPAGGDHRRVLHRGAVTRPASNPRASASRTRR